MIRLVIEMLILLGVPGIIASYVTKRWIMPARNERLDHKTKMKQLEEENAELDEFLNKQRKQQSVFHTY